MSKQLRPLKERRTPARCAARAEYHARRLDRKQTRQDKDIVPDVSWFNLHRFFRLT